MPLDKNRFNDLWGNLNDVLEEFIEPPDGERELGDEEPQIRDEQAAPTAESPTESPLDQLISSESKSKAEIVLETGMTPQELLIELLDEYDGKMRQQQVVNATGWSEASVSRLLTKMEHAEQITRVQIGNEKVVFLPDHVPDAAKHPFQRIADEEIRRERIVNRS
ncbi:helix-turn-helix domain-containing protein [Haladaptatus sp. DJG-WS-42]|uniref:helix-turn-helix transcriptional regulator n=1 Tax=Haladaptatus sp. DJG-WS-42 TaxID=3120516 RepID=UPI0030D4BCEF